LSSSDPDPDPLFWEPDPLLPETDESSSSVVGGDVDAEPLDTVDTVDGPPPDPEPLLPDPEESSSSSSIVADAEVVPSGGVVAGADCPAVGVVDADPPFEGAGAGSVVVVVDVGSVVVVVDVGSVVLIVDVELLGGGGAGEGGF
jgi:hypothetical protein